MSNEFDDGYLAALSEKTSPKSPRSTPSMTAVGHNRQSSERAYRVRFSPRKRPSTRQGGIVGQCQEQKLLLCFDRPAADANKASTASLHTPMRRGDMISPNIYDIANTHSISSSASTTVRAEAASTRMLRSSSLVIMSGFSASHA